MPPKETTDRKQNQQSGDVHELTFQPCTYQVSEPPEGRMMSWLAAER